MTKQSLFNFLFVMLLSPLTGQAFVASPVILQSGQALQLICKADQERFCLKLCGNASLCMIPEPTCRSCAGTENLKLKLILDEVGASIRVDAKPQPDQELLDILRSNSWMSLHPKTLYNYSSNYDNLQLRAQFFALCLQEYSESSVPGILIVGLSMFDEKPGYRLGALCTSEPYFSTQYYHLSRTK